MTTQMVWGLLLPFAGTTLGAGCVFFLRRQLRRGVQRVLAGFAAGVMTAASVWSLLLPALEEAVLANVVSTGLVSLLVDENYNGAVAHSVYYGLVLLPGFEERFLHGDVVAYGVLVQLALDGQTEELHKIRRFMQELGIPASLAEMGVPLDRELLAPALAEAVRGPDMEHIPYPVTEEMLFEAMARVEAL